MSLTASRSSGIIGNTDNRTLRLRWSTAIALLAATLLALLPLTNLGDRLELRTQDARFAWRGPRPTKARIVLVTLGAETQAAWPEPMAFWGGHYSRLIREARKNGARCVGLDIIPAINADEALQSLVARAAERASSGKGGADLDAVLSTPEMNPDRELTDAMRKAGNVVIPDSRRGGSLLAAEVLNQIDPKNIVFIDPPVQEDDAVRTAPLEVTGTLRPIPGFPALAAAYGEGRSNPSDSLILPELGRRAEATIRGVTLSYFWINYTRIDATEPAFVRIPAWRLAAGDLTETERQAIRDSVVLVGDTSDQGEDWHRIPGGRSEEGVAIQAQAVATLLDHQALRRLAPWKEALLTLGLLLLMLPLLFRLPVGWGLAATASVGGLWWIIGCRMFLHGCWILPMAAPLLGFASVFLSLYAVRSAEEAFARRHVERTFGHSVTPTIRDYLLASPQHMRLGGEETEASVLFFDLRGSTHFASSRTPQMVIAELNVLYEVIVPLIEQRGGLLYRFLGDGFLAVFGAPRPMPSHARSACLAAVDIMRSLDQLNLSRQAAGLDAWQAGCGVHTGLLVYGNLGATGRAEFTVIGDTVNLAARLEGLNKGMNSRIIVSESTYTGSGNLPADGPVTCQIAGRSEPINVYVLDRCVLDTSLEGDKQ